MHPYTDVFCFLMNAAAEYCTVICGDSGFIVGLPVPVLSSKQFLCITTAYKDVLVFE